MCAEDHEISELKYDVKTRKTINFNLLLEPHFAR